MPLTEMRKPNRYVRKALTHSSLLKAEARGKAEGGEWESWSILVKTLIGVRLKLQSYLYLRTVISTEI